MPPISRRRSFPQRRAWLVAGLAALASAASGVTPTAAPGTVTIGQLADPGTALSCTLGFDALQPTVTTGRGYVVPDTGGVVTWTLTSWSHRAGNPNPGQAQGLTMKLYRHVSGRTYKVVGRDGPRDLVPDANNAFAGLRIPARAGDVIGYHTTEGLTGCKSGVQGERFLELQSSSVQGLADGEAGEFEQNENARLNLTAELTPENDFALGEVRRNKKRGRATLIVDVPNPGGIVVSGNGVSSPGAIAGAPGPVRLLIKASGKKRRKLERKGRVVVRPTVTYTPTGGEPSSESPALKLRKK